VGTIFGDSMDGAIDPMFMIMLIQRLGPAGRGPGRGGQHPVPAARAQHAVGRPSVEPADVGAVRAAADEHGKTERTFLVDLVDDAGEVHASFEEL
jgi:hypothetical protein